MANETNTYKKLKNLVQNNFPKRIIVHHGGGTDAQPLLDTSNHTAQDMEAWHLAKGWDGLGYHEVIHKDGAVWLGRPEHRNGAHTAGQNEQSIGLCLSGNFDATLPTEAQKVALAGRIAYHRAKYNIPVEEIVPHRTFATKSCYGNKLANDWAQKLITSSTPITSKDILIARVGKISTEVEELRLLINEL